LQSPDYHHNLFALGFGNPARNSREMQEYPGIIIGSKIIQLMEQNSLSTAKGIYKRGTRNADETKSLQLGQALLTAKAVAVV
jgi:hypothetical protein